MDSGAAARVYVVNNHEPDFYPASTERLLAKLIHTVTDCTASPPAPGCETCLIERYEAPSDAFQLGVDHNNLPRPLDVARRPGTVHLLRPSCHSPPRGPRRSCLRFKSCIAVAPDMRIVLFGDEALKASFPYEHLGVPTPRR